jgi:hypothetical protein
LLSRPRQLARTGRIRCCRSGYGGRGSDADKALERCGGEARFGGHLADLKAWV